MVGYGFVQVAYAEANAANGMAKPKYLEFGLTHEAGHMLDPLNFPQPPAGDGATAVKMFPNRAAITAFNNNWHREVRCFSSTLRIPAAHTDYAQLHLV